MKGRACPSESYDGVPFEVQGCMPEECNVSGTGDHAPVPTGSTLGSGSRSGKEGEGKVELDAINFGQDVPMAMMTPVPFQSWVHMFLRQVLSAKTRFSYFMLRTLSASRNGRDDSVATALFPIPMPFVDIVWSGPDLSSQKKRRVRAFKKMMHLIVMALSYEHFRNPMSILQLIRRRPAAKRRAVFARVRAFLKARGPPATVSLAGCGRKSFQLDARMRELSEAIESLGLQPTCLYHHSAAGHHVPEDNTVCEELRPYRPGSSSPALANGNVKNCCQIYYVCLLWSLR